MEVCVGGRWGTAQTNNPEQLAQTFCESRGETLEFYNTASCYGESILIAVDQTFGPKSNTSKIF